MSLRLSVVIPYYRQIGLLSKCLARLAEQTLSGDSFEIIVVNNDVSSDDLLSLCRQYPNVRVINCSHGGSYLARNVGIRYSNAPIVAFTDSDCLPSLDWLNHALSVFDENPHLMAIAGDIIVSDSKSIFISTFERTFSFQQREFVHRAHYAATANLFVRKLAFTFCGRFDSSLYSGGDLEWGKRFFKYFGSIAFRSNIIVEHPARSSLIQYFSQRLRIRSGLSLLHTKDRNIWAENLSNNSFLVPLHQIRRWPGNWKYFDSLSLQMRRKVILFFRLQLLFEYIVEKYSSASLRKKLVRIDKFKRFKLADLNKN